MHSSWSPHGNGSGTSTYRQFLKIEPSSVEPMGGTTAARPGGPHGSPRALPVSFMRSLTLRFCQWVGRQSWAVTATHPTLCWGQRPGGMVTDVSPELPEATSGNGRPSALFYTVMGFSSLTLRSEWGPESGDTVPCELFIASLTVSFAAHSELTGRSRIAYRTVGTAVARGPCCAKPHPLGSKRPGQLH